MHTLMSFCTQLWHTNTKIKISDIFDHDICDWLNSFNFKLLPTDTIHHIVRIHAVQTLALVVLRLPRERLGSEV